MRASPEDILSVGHSLRGTAPRPGDPLDVAAAIRALSTGELKEALHASTSLSGPVIDEALHAAFSSLEEELANIQGLAGERAGLGFVHLASNVFTACLRPLATAAVLGVSLLVRVSSREGVLAEAIAARLNDEKLARLHVLRFPRDADAHFISASEHADFVEAYGSDETLERLRGLVHGAKFIRRGHGLGAVLLGDAVSPEGYAGLGADVAAFDQQGCLSPRVVFAAGDLHHHAKAIHQALQDIEGSLPRMKRLPPDIASASTMWRGSAAALHTLLEGDTHALAIAERPFALGPTHRHLLLRPLEAAEEALKAFGPHLKVVGHEGLSDLAVYKGLTGARFCSLGHMQRPRLSEGADGYPPGAGFIVSPRT